MNRSRPMIAAATLLAGFGVRGPLPSALGQGPASTTRPALVPAKPAVGEGRVFRLRVAAADTGAPVPRATAKLSLAMRRELRTADDRGVFEIRHSTGPADTSINVDVQGDGYALQRHFWGGQDGPIPDEATIRLNPGEALGGVVKDEQGRPIAGATVSLWSHNYKNRDKEDKHELLYDLRATTGPDGRWQTRSAPETNGEILGLRAIHPDHVSDRDYDTSKDQAPKIADLRAGTAVTRMKKGVAVSGLVLDAEGNPVAGALVTSTDRRDSFYAGELKEFDVKSDAHGLFHLPPAPPDQRLFVLARASGHSPGETSLEVGRDKVPLEVKLGRPQPFRGRVVDTAGRPIAGTFVVPATWRGYRCLGVYLWTDADGRFRWDDAPFDPILVNVDKQGYMGIFHYRHVGSDEEIKFVLRRCLSITGSIRDAVTNKRIEKIRVELGIPDPAAGTIRWGEHQNVWASSGELVATLDAEVPATYLLRFSAAGYETVVSRPIKSDEGAVKLDLKLTKENPGIPED